MHDRDSALAALAALPEQDLLALVDALEVGELPDLPAVPENADAIVRLSKTEDFAVLRARARQSQDNYYANIARGLATQKAPVDQRELDYKRGYWAGARYFLEILPSLVVGNLAREQVEEAGGDPRTPPTPPWMQS